MKIMTHNQKEIIQQAGEYLKLGFSLIPINSKNKKPCVKWKQFQNLKADMSEINEWLKKFPNMALAVVTGKESNLAVIDFDSAQAVAMGKALGIMDTPLVKTKRGMHAYYQYRAGIKNKQKIGFIPDTDIRGEGGYAILPPSEVSGFKYSWVEDRSLFDILTDEFPEIIHLHVKSSKTSITELLKGVPEGKRTSSGLIILGSYINQGYTKKSVTDKLIQWNLKCDPPKKDSEVLEMIDDIWNKHQNSISTLSTFNSNQSQSLLNTTFTVSDENYTPIPTGRYLLKLINIKSSFGIVQRLDFIFCILKHQNGSKKFKNNELTVYINVPKNQKPRSNSKLTIWASALLNMPIDKLKPFKPSYLIGKKCWGKVTLDGSTNRIVNIQPFVSQGK